MGRLLDAFRKFGARQARALMGSIYLAPLFAVAFYLVYRWLPFRPLYWIWLFFAVTAVVLLVTAAAARLSKPIRSRKSQTTRWQTRELRITTLEEARRQV